MTRVFVSHAKDDEPVARAARDVLRTAGFDVRLDEEVAPGESWTDQIHDAVESSDAIVFVLGTSDSALQQREMRWALERSWSDTPPTVVPVVVGDREVPSALAEFQALRLEQQADGRARLEGLDALIAAVGADAASRHVDLSQVALTKSRQSADAIRSWVVEQRRKS
jgi:hypothetical protein